MSQKAETVRPKILTFIPLFTCMTYCFCYISCDFILLIPCKFQQNSWYCLWDINFWKWHCYTNVVNMKVTRNTFDSQLSLQFVLKMATFSRNTPSQLNTPCLVGFVIHDNALWETMPLFNETVFQVFHVVNPALVHMSLLQKSIQCCARRPRFRRQFFQKLANAFLVLRSVLCLLSWEPF